MRSGRNRKLRMIQAAQACITTPSFEANSAFMAAFQRAVPVMTQKQFTQIIAALIDLKHDQNAVEELKRILS